jgi:hypothetical protein
MEERPVSVSNIEKAEFAHDIQVGLSRKSVPEFENLPLIGMAGKLALNIRGLGAIEGPVLRQVADHFFDIPAATLPLVLEILAEIEFIQVIREGKSIKSVIPDVPHFSSVYDGLGAYVGTLSLNEHEELAIAVLGELKTKPEKRDALFNRLGAEKNVFRRVESISSEGGLVIPKRARGQDILISPFYFSDSLDALARQAASGGAKNISRLLQLLKQAQGWPLSMILKSGEINGSKLSPTEVQLLNELVADGVLKPPSLKVQKTGSTEHFVFTPAQGGQRLDGSSREIYERAMALVAAVRKGQLLPDAYRIHSPVALLSKLRSQKFIRASTEAAAQYTNLVTLRVGRLKEVQPGWFRFELIDTPENLKAVDDAIAMFRDGSSISTGINDDARLALQRDEAYIQSLVSAAKLRETARPVLDEVATREYDQLLLNF